METSEKVIGHALNAIIISIPTGIFVTPWLNKKLFSSISGGYSYGPSGADIVIAHGLWVGVLFTVLFLLSRKG